MRAKIEATVDRQLQISAQSPAASHSKVDCPSSTRSRQRRGRSFPFHPTRATSLVIHLYAKPSVRSARGISPSCIAANGLFTAMYLLKAFLRSPGYRSLARRTDSGLRFSAWYAIRVCKAISFLEKFNKECGAIGSRARPCFPCLEDGGFDPVCWASARKDLQTRCALSEEMLCP